MLERLDAADHVLALRLSGTLTSEDVAEYRRLLDALFSRHARIGLLADVTGLDDLGGRALAEGVRADLDALAHLDKIGRVALVADRQWPGALAGLLGRLLPGVELRAFRAAEREAALGWAGERSAAPEPKGRLRIIPTDQADVLAFEMDGRFPSEDLKRAIDEVNAFLGPRERVRMLGRLGRWGGIDPRWIMQGGLLSMKLAAIRKVERYALVGGPDWMRRALQALDALFPDMAIRAFAAESEDEAWAWIGARPAGR
jgi:hypothetical protein